MVRYCMDFFKCTLWMYVGHIFSWRKRHLQLPTWKFNWISLDLGFEATSIWVRTTTYIWLVGGLEHFSFFHILGISYSQLTFIFFRGVAQPPTRWLWYDYGDLIGQSHRDSQICHRCFAVECLPAWGFHHFREKCQVTWKKGTVVGTVSIINQNHFHIFIYFH